MAETGEALDTVNEGEPRPLDKTVESKTQPVYPFPYKDKDEQRGGDVLETPLSYWDHIDPLDVTKPEKDFLETWTIWMDRQASGNSPEAQSRREAILKTIKGETPTESNLANMSFGNAEKGHKYPFPYAEGDGDSGSDVLEVPLTYTGNIVPLGLSPNEESFLETFSIYTDRYKNPGVKAALEKVVQDVTPKTTT